MLTEKYGEPSDVVEKFDVESFAQPRDDQDRFYNVKSDKCKYYSKWQTLHLARAEPLPNDVANS